LPTFRQSSITGYSDSELGSSLPIFSETADWEALDQKLEETGIELAVKLHPLQDAVQLTKKSFKHIKIYDQERFKAENLDLYTWLAGSAALLTDYSSVFYDYLLLDRPIGFTEDDMESYQDTRGFAVDDPDWFRPGARLKTPADVCHFIEDVSMAKDGFVERRKEVNDLSQCVPRWE
jgi:CDP-glycerol glycerophosphotransferase (TagB/SpsB family)